LVTFTVTLGMAAPEGSVTVPRIVAVDAPWPRAGGAVKTTNVKKQINQLIYIVLRRILKLGLAMFTANSFRVLERGVLNRGPLAGSSSGTTADRRVSEQYALSLDNVH